MAPGRAGAYRGRMTGEREQESARERERERNQERDRERELGRHIGLDLARWRGWLFRVGGSDRSGTVWLTALDGGEELGELANGVRRDKPARLVPVDELSELYRVSASCRVDGIPVEVMGIDGDTVHVSYTGHGANSFTRAHGFTMIDWDWYVRDFDRSEVEELRVVRQDRLERDRAHAGLLEAFGEDIRHLGRSQCRRPSDSEPWPILETVPGPDDFTVPKVGAAGEPKIRVPVEELASWTVRVAYAVHHGREVCLDASFVGYTARISTADAAWAATQGMKPARRWHPVHWPQPYWEKNVPLTELTDFRAERIDVLAQIAARGTRHAVADERH